MSRLLSPLSYGAVGMIVPPEVAGRVGQPNASAM